MGHSQIRWATLGVAVVGAVAGAQVMITPPTPSTQPVAATLPTANSATLPTTIPSAEQVLQDIVGQRGTEPGGAERGGAGAGGGAAMTQGSSPPVEADGLVREQQMIELRTGHLKKNDATGSMMFIFDKGEPDYPPMGVVPCRELAMMEDASEFGTLPMTFRIVAEVTRYRGKNYLYFKTGIEPRAASSAPSTAPLINVTPSTMASAGQVDVVAPNPPATKLLRETDPISGRIARLVKDPKTGAELIAFDSDGKEMRDPPMGVVPGEYLAVMETASNYGANPVKFRVSGEVTQYRGKDFLYLKFVQAVRDLHQGLGG